MSARVYLNLQLPKHRFAIGGGEGERPLEHLHVTAHQLKRTW